MHEDLRLHLPDLVDEMEPLLGRQLELAAPRLRGGAAMQARQIARARVLPDHDERTDVEVVDVGRHTSPMLRAHSRYATGEISDGLISARPPQYTFV